MLPPVAVDDLKPFTQTEWDRIKALWPELPPNDCDLSQWYLTIKHLEHVLSVELEQKTARDAEVANLQKSHRNLETIIAMMLRSRPGFQERMYSKVQKTLAADFSLEMRPHPDGITVRLNEPVTEKNRILVAHG